MPWRWFDEHSGFPAKTRAIAQASAGDFEAMLQTLCALVRSNDRLLRMLLFETLETAARNASWRLVLGDDPADLPPIEDPHEWQEEWPQRYAAQKAYAEARDQLEQLWAQADTGHAEREAAIASADVSEAERAILRVVLEIRAQAEWCRVEGKAAWEAYQRDHAAARLAAEQDRAWPIRVYVDDCLRRHRAHQPSEAEVLEWLADEHHEARGPENDLDALAELDGEMRGRVDQWHVLASRLRLLAEQIEVRYGVKAEPLPPVGSRRRTPLSHVEQLRREAADGYPPTTAEIADAKQMDESATWWGSAMADVSDQPNYAGSAATVSKYVRAACAVDLTQWTEDAIAAYVAELAPKPGKPAKSAQLRASYLVDGAEWLERAAAILEADLEQRAPFGLKRRAK
jgi:hypothetical protein